MRRLNRPVAELIAEARNGESASLGRLLSLIEAGGPSARDIAREVLASDAFTHTVGLTGAPGAGKSTLTGALVREARHLQETVAVLAVDPSSPYSGGAILGDRIRLDDYSLDPGVFVRSMANRGHLGGLSLAAPEAVRLLSVLGFDLVLVETVGVGQAELAITSAVDTTLVVVTPGWGDDVQAAKAGILEIADVFVINKADRDGFEVTRADLEYMVNRTHPEVDAWVPPIIETVATKGIGLNQLQAAISAHRSWLEARDLLVRRRLDRLWSEVEVVVSARFEDLVRNAMIREVATDIKIQLSVGAIDPCAAADEMVRAVCDSVLRLQLDPRPTPKRGA